MKRVLLLFVVLISAYTAKSQSLRYLITSNEDFYKADIALNDGSTLDGYAVVPIKMTTKEIQFKKSDTSDETEIVSDSISTITFHLSKSDSVVFDRVHWRLLTKRSGHTYKKKIWVVRLFTNQFINVYKSSGKYYVNEDGEFIYVSQAGGAFAAFSYYLKRENEDIVSYVAESGYYGASVSGVEKQFRNRAANYFQDEPELVKRILNKDFLQEDFEVLVRAYIEHMKAKEK
ncbi:hypothetical protein [Neptunitalea lumnitzerae]|uniref:DUF4468 domain-containing protein n=1 Tax=Neptunitalea lumnitzerae TaxID=2965509 RepID=A0ABQ5MEW4_9FLAO|nr:hypothetical protein [Neptunitalea sp. Y10]GLB47935.1 hypothetical protein Y10_03030 [Neptunitalea sp. Y10]